MNVTIRIVFFILLLPAIGLANDLDIPIRINISGPSQGTEIMNLEEAWRVGGDDEDVIFGRIVDLKKGADDNLYVLDNQLCQVMVFSPYGEHLRDLSREGDGPGELRQPTGLFFFSENTLGIGVGYPGKIITLGLDGTPGEACFPIGEPSEGNIGIMTGAQYFEGLLAACGGRMVFGTGGEGHTDRFLSLSEDLGVTNTHIIEKATPLDLTGQKYVEATDYYVEQRWALGAKGKIYVAEKRDSYEVSVYDKSGNMALVFGRKYTARKRSKTDKERIRPIINVNNSQARNSIIEDYDECVSRLMFNHNDGNLWVQNPHGENDLPDGVLEKWDVFSTQGEYLKEVVIALGHEMETGTIYLVPGNQLVVVKGTGSSFVGDESPEENDSSDGAMANEEVEPLEIICYDIR